MRIFGGIIPFIGWRVIGVDEDGEPNDEGRCETDALEVEWLGVGATLYVGTIRHK